MISFLLLILGFFCSSFSSLGGWFKGQVIEVEKCDFGRLESKGLGAREEHTETRGQES